MQTAETAPSVSEQVRKYVQQKYIEPTRARGLKQARITVGEVHRALGLTNRVPLVCNALKSKVFLKENGLRLLAMEGPPSGLSTTVTYTYEFESAYPEPAISSHPFWNLRGVAAELFREYGGGEAFLRNERSGFFGPSEAGKEPEA